MCVFVVRSYEKLYRYKNIRGRWKRPNTKWHELWENGRGKWKWAQKMMERQSKIWADLSLWMKLWRRQADSLTPCNWLSCSGTATDRLPLPLPLLLAAHHAHHLILHASSLHWLATWPRWSESQEPDRKFSIFIYPRGRNHISPQ